MGSEDRESEVSYAASKLEPSDQCRNRISDCFAPPSTLEGVALVSRISSGEGNREFGDERLKRNDGSIANLDGKPVDSRIDDAILIEGRLAVIDVAAKRELRIQIHYEPVVLGEGARRIGCNVHVFASISDC